MSGNFNRHHLLVLLLGITTATVPCPCSDTQLCMPLSESSINDHGRTVAFTNVRNSSTIGDNWDFDKVHAWAPFNNLGPLFPKAQELYCLAHAHNIRVLTWGYESWNGSSCPITEFYAWALASDPRVYNTSAVTSWAREAASCAVSHGFDGLLLDMEGIGGPPLGPSSMLDAIFFAVCQLKEELTARLPHAIILWTADTGPYFPVANLTEAGCVDTWLDMAYDWCVGQEYHSAIRNRANSPWAFIDQGPTNIVETWTGDFEVPGDQLGIAFPWYGCEFNCSGDGGGDAHEPAYEGCAEATLVPGSPTLDEVLSLWLPNATGPVVLNATTVTKYVNNGGDDSEGYAAAPLRQVWYDDAETLKVKYDTALRAGVALVGAWTVDMADDHPDVARAMWEALPRPLLAPN